MTRSLCILSLANSLIVNRVLPAHVKSTYRQSPLPSITDNSDSLTRPTDSKQVFTGLAKSTSLSPDPFLIRFDLPFSQGRKCYLPDGLLPKIQDAEKSLVCVDPIFSCPLARVVMFSVINNFAGYGTLPMSNVLSFLRQQSSSRLLHYLEAVTCPAADALAENLFKSAIEAQDAQLVKALLQRGVDPDSHIFFNGRCYTVLERSAELGDVALVEHLLSAGADPNWSFEEDANDTREIGALEHAVGVKGNYLRVDPELVRLLVTAKCTITKRFLDRIIRYQGDDDIMEILLSSHQELDYAELLRHDILATILRWLDHSQATRLIEKILNSLNGRWPELFSFPMLISAINEGGRQGDLTVVQRLLSHPDVQYMRPEHRSTILANAVRGGNYDLVSFLLDVGFKASEVEHRSNYDLDLDWEHLSCPFGEAVLANNEELQNLLEQKGALRGMDKELTSSITRIEWYQYERTRFQSAINAASKVGNLLLVQRCLERFRRTEADDKYLGEALLIAADLDQTEICTLLLDCGADVHMIGRRGDLLKSTINLALERKNTILVRKLLDAAVNIRYNYELAYLIEWNDYIQIRDCVHAIEQAVEWGNHDIIGELISAGVDVNAFSSISPLVIGVAKGDLALVQRLLGSGAEINHPKSQKSALQAAVENQDERMLHYLLSQGANPVDTQALSDAVNVAPQLLPILLDASRKRFPTGKLRCGAQALCTAIQAQETHTIQFLVQAEVDINTFCAGQVKYELSTPLGVAIKQDHGANTKLVELLLLASGDPNSFVHRDDFEVDDHPIIRTALIAAIETSCLRMVELLLSHGARIDRPASRGLTTTPLQTAARTGSLDIVQLLIDRGADVNEAAADRRGATALQFAARRGFGAIVCKLLDHGADVNAPRPKGRTAPGGMTALEGAAQFGRIDVVQILWNATFGLGFDQFQIERAMELAESNGHYATKALIASLAASLPPTEASMSEARIQECG